MGGEDHTGRAGKRGLTTDPEEARNSPVDPVTGMQEVYLILSEEERAMGFVRPVRKSYMHIKCGTITTMSDPLAETYARNPYFYGATFCVRCHAHYPVGVTGEFVWVVDKTPTDQKVGT